MSSLLLPLAVLLAITPGETESLAMDARAELLPSIEARIAADLGGLVALYRECHANPEVSLAEAETARRAALRFEHAGFAVTPNVGGHGVVGVLENGDGPVILIRGDMDALPIVEETGLPYASKVTTKGKDGAAVGVMHACGHDVHVTCLAGTAGVLSALRSEWRGTVVVVAQPAEEVGMGAKAMLADGLFTRFPKPQAAIALHVSNSRLGTVSVTPGFAFANVDSVDVVIHGRGGHGSRPQDTIDPIVIGAHVVVALQTIVSRRMDPQEPAVVTVGSFHAGSKHNIISDTAKLELTVRTYGDDVRGKVLDAIREIAVNTCRAHGARQDPDVIVREEQFCPATFNDPELSAGAMEVLAMVLGASNVLEEKPLMGGEDFGLFSKALGVPGLMFRLGTISEQRIEGYAKAGDPVPSLHSSRYFPDAEGSIANGVKCLTSVALALLARSETER